MAELSAIEISGVINATALGLDTDALDVVMNGVNKLSATGRADLQSLRVSGVSTYNASGLAGEIELRQGDADAAIPHFQTAVELEDALTYGEPPTWFYPMRQSLGKALLAAGRAQEAETAYREDLKRFPANGWSLFGLYQCLEAQGKDGEAQAVRAKFEQAWKDADITLMASRF